MQPQGTICILLHIRLYVTLAPRKSFDRALHGLCRMLSFTVTVKPFIQNNTSAINCPDDCLPHPA
jgi:hypothetical protein